MMDLEGRRALVTGSGRGIGRQIAIAMAAEGAVVVVTARSRDQIEQTSELVRSAGGEAHAIVCDITDDESVAHLARESKRLAGGRSEEHTSELQSH